MIVVDSQKAYQGAYAKRVQNRQNTQQMTEAQKDAATKRVKEAVTIPFPFRKKERTI